MSQQERKERIRKFWEHYAPMQTGLDNAAIEWMKEDDCWVENRKQAIATA